MAHEKARSFFRGRDRLTFILPRTTTGAGGGKAEPGRAFSFQSCQNAGFVSVHAVDLDARRLCGVRVRGFVGLAVARRIQLDAPFLELAHPTEPNGEA
jgi:hypothetical protein